MARLQGKTALIAYSAEAALLLCSGEHVGQVTYSRRFIHSIGASVYSLDGQQKLGDAFLAGDPDAPGA